MQTFTALMRCQIKIPTDPLLIVKSEHTVSYQIVGPVHTFTRRLRIQINFPLFAEESVMARADRLPGQLGWVA